MLWIDFNAGDRADYYTLGSIIVTYTFSAERWIYMINFFTLIDRIVWTFGLTDVAINALVRNMKSHNL